jgi:hypothetical protein
VQQAVLHRGLQRLHAVDATAAAAATADAAGIYLYTFRKSSPITADLVLRRFESGVFAS